MASFEGFYSFTALPNWIFKKQLKTEGGWLTSAELSVLLAVQFIAGSKNIQANYSNICACSGVSRQKASECMVLLREKGLIDKITCLSSKGVHYEYKLLLWEPKNSESPQDAEPVTFEQAASVHSVPRRAKAKFVANEEMVPVKLQKTAPCVCDFFNNHKGGAKTNTSFNCLIANLIQIVDDPGGGIDAVKNQLQEAIERSKSGEKKWHSITYSNWEKFGKKAKSGWGQQLQGSARPSAITLVSKFEGDEAAELNL